MRIALLRAVNLPGHGKVSMADLKKLAADLGLDDPRTLLQSGNLVFDSKKKPAALEALLEAEAKKHLGLDTDFFVRTPEEWSALIDDNPFPGEAKADPGHLVALFTKEPPDRKKVAALQAAIEGLGAPERARAGARHLYLVYPDGIGRSKVTNAFIDRRIGTSGTGRNWNTVLKLAAAIKAPSAG